MLIKKIAITFGIFLWFSGPALAAPAPSGASANIVTGNSIIISGSSFGAKTTAAPIRFDQFEGGTNGNILSSPWQSYNGGSLYRNGAAHSGSMSAGRNIPSGEQFNVSWLEFSGKDEVFYSYWLLVNNVSAVDDMNLKLNRISTSYAGGYPYNGEGTQSLTTYYWNDGAPDPYLAYWPDEGGEEGVSGWDHINAPANQWGRVDCRSKVSSPAGASNGVAECTIMVPGVNGWIDYVGQDDLVTRSSGRSWQYTSILLGGMDGNPGTHNYDVYIDDVYVDSTPARVEVCKESTWATRKHCEIQPATAWGTSSITIVANAGTLAAGTNYLYVVDSTNTANTSGVGVTVGSGADTTAPSTTISTTDPSAISSDALTVTGSSSDAVGVSGCKWRIGSAPDETHGTGCTGTTSFSCSTSGYLSGANSVYVGCDDAAGNYGSDSMVVNYTPPGNGRRVGSGGASLGSGGGSFR